MMHMILGVRVNRMICEPLDSRSRPERFRQERLTSLTNGFYVCPPELSLSWIPVKKLGSHLTTLFGSEQGTNVRGQKPTLEPLKLPLI